MKATGAADSPARAHVEDVGDAHSLEQFYTRGVVKAPQIQFPWHDLRGKLARLLPGFLGPCVNMTTSPTGLTTFVLRMRNQGSAAESQDREKKHQRSLVILTSWK